MYERLQREISDCKNSTAVSQQQIMELQLELFGLAFPCGAMGKTVTHKGPLQYGGKHVLRYRFWEAEEIKIADAV